MNPASSSQQPFYTTPEAFGANSERVKEPLLVAFPQTLRQANLPALPLLLKQAQRRLTSPNLPAHTVAAFHLEIACCFRAAGYLERTAEHLQAASDKIAFLPNSATLWATLQREQVFLLLDRNEWAQAAELASHIDATEIERRGQPSLFFRDEKQISLATRLLWVQVSLCAGRLEETQAQLQAAVQQYAQEEAARTATLAKQGYLARTLRTPASRRQAQKALDTRHELRFLEAVRLAATGQLEGFELLAQLEITLGQDPESNKMLQARVIAANGLWDGHHPPPGINRFEARRWHQIALGQWPAPPTEPVAAPQTEDTQADAVPDVNSVPASDLPTAQNGNYVEALETVTTAFLDRLDQIYRLLPATPPPHLPQVAVPDSLNQSNYAFGGAFSHFDLVAMLQTAEQSQFTGYLHLTWPAGKLAESIQDGKLHPAAHHGEGFIFMAQGQIIDAAGPQDAPAPDVEAYTMLEMLLQISLAIGLGSAPEGQAHAFFADDAMNRTRRLALPNTNSLMSVITDREKQLGIGNDSLDTIGEWD